MLSGGGERCATSSKPMRPCFVSRQSLYALTDPTKITTLVVWTSNDIYDAWRASPARVAAMSGAEALWSKPPESERFEVAGI